MSKWVSHYVARVLVVTVLASWGPLASVVRADLCGDADGDGRATVSDAVNILRVAASLPSVCPLSRCDFNSSGAIDVTDGINVLRVAADLPTITGCVSDPFIASIQGQDGVSGTFDVASALTAPAEAPPTITNVVFGDAFAAGRLNTVTVEYDVSGFQADESTGSSLLVASTREAADTTAGFFELPLESGRGSVTIALEMKPDVAGSLFTLKLANGAAGVVVGRIYLVAIVVRAGSAPACGNRVIDAGETCDPPGFGCPAAAGAGFCNATCACEFFPRFVDHGDGTVIDTQTGLQWEKKTGVVGDYLVCGVSCDEQCATSCPDAHDVNNLYQWCRSANVDFATNCDSASGCLDADQDQVCDDPTVYRPDGGLNSRNFSHASTVRRASLAIATGACRPSRRTVRLPSSRRS